LPFASTSRVAAYNAAAQRRLASSLVFIEHKDGKVNESSLHAVTAAKCIDGDVNALVASSSASLPELISQVKKIKGLNKVFAVKGDSEAYSKGLAEAVTPAIASFLSSTSSSPTHLLAAHTAVAKNIFPRLAGQLDVPMISDILSVDAAGQVFERPIYAGNAILKVKVQDKPGKVKVITVRTTAFDKAEVADAEQSIEVEEVAAEEKAVPTSFAGEELTTSSRPDLSSASRVVSGGRALKSQEQFNQIMEPLADSLGAAIGASRAAVDAGYADNSLQVGQTGKVVAPALYMAVGISGAIQHLAGMKESKLIVAINKDADAPIFQIADVGLVADLFQAVPELTEKIKAAKA